MEMPICLPRENNRAIPHIALTLYLGVMRYAFGRARHPLGKLYNTGAGCNLKTSIWG
jgi:hypothetical protein